ncbi:hypothetical protein FIBSPDRAFT_880676, partial [Athelia psychrophila]
NLDVLSFPESPSTAFDANGPAWLRSSSSSGRLCFRLPLPPGRTAFVYACSISSF